MMGEWYMSREIGEAIGAADQEFVGLVGGIGGRVSSQGARIAVLETGFFNAGPVVML
jgi:hypothetical protein